MADPLGKPLVEVLALLRAGELTPLDLLDATLERIERVNPAINAMAYLAGDSARAQAEAATRRWADGEPRGELDGVPVTVKDSVRTVGLPWRHGSAAYAELPVSTSDAPPAARLKEAGAVIVGNTTMPDLGMLAAGVSSLYGITRNPWDPRRSTGGSSAGAAASLAAGIGFGSVGSDIAGSVRLPAAQCGLVALKPTQGRVPHLPVSTMRSAGPMARTVEELIAVYRVISRPDPRDVWSLPPEAEDRCADSLDPRVLRVGVLTDLGYGPTPSGPVLAAVRAAAAALASAGATVEPVAPPFGTEPGAGAGRGTGAGVGAGVGADPSPALDRLFQVRAAAELAALTDGQRALVLPAVADWAAEAAGRTATALSQDTDVVLAAAEQVRARLHGYHLVLSPVLPVVGFPAEHPGVDVDRPLAHTGFTAWFNQTGQPAGSLCFGMDAGCPVGVQVAGRRFDDQLVLRMMHWLEGQRSFPMDWPLRTGALDKLDAEVRG
ncbi:MAG TPA: amidase family protein [Pseudonocardia sp.]|uniref:amidase family protein n=1 Tax=Pseudonocardia sp. TaxID=60912 RepID=UPI002B86E4BB|nr:amidase family protein [Pseudonocardia sp.]HTF47700.1 amidase family protein [Pseudonocardia sp.]